MEKISESEYLDLTPRQAVNRLRGLLENTVEEDTYERRGGVWVKLIHPEVLVWNGIKPPLPPQEGKVVRFIYNQRKANHTTTMPDGVLLDFTRTSGIHGVDYACFGVGAIRISRDEKVAIDCTRLQRPGGVQAILPNLFIDRGNN